MQQDQDVNEDQAVTGRQCPRGGPCTMPSTCADIGPCSGAETFHGVSGETLTVSHDEDGVMIRADFCGTKLSAAGARELARHLIACADRADDWMTSAADLGEPGDPWAEPAVTESGEHVASVYRADGPRPEPEPWQ